MPTLGTTGKLILAFVTLLLGAVLISTVATEGLAKTDKSVITGEVGTIAATRGPGDGEINTTTNLQLSIAQAPTGWKQTEGTNCDITNFDLYNASGAEMTLDTDYETDLDAGTWNPLATTAMNMSNTQNGTTLDYTYCGDDYMNIGWGRTVLNLVPGFFALAVLGASLLLFYSVARDYGIF